VYIIQHINLITSNLLNKNQRIKHKELLGEAQQLINKVCKTGTKLYAYTPGSSGSSGSSGSDCV
jgi:hypothetical protein